LLLGPRYALLRREFGPAARRPRDVPPIARKVLVTLGGSDPDNRTLTILRALQRCRVEGLHAVVVAGAASPHLGELEEAAATGPARVEVRTAVGDMSGLMAWADLAIGAGGITSWERAALGLPSLVVVIADNQRDIAAALHQAGLSWNIGEAAALGEDRLRTAIEALSRDGAERKKMAERGRQLVDGRGGGRVVAYLTGAPSHESPLPGQQLAGLAGDPLPQGLG
jgi:spore coat polysaccharide biosynthesis predicted glycosyltransferase SpsG